MPAVDSACVRIDSALDCNRSKLRVCVLIVSVFATVGLVSECDLSESKAVMANGLCITGAACMSLKEECVRLQAAERSDLRRLHPVATIVPQRSE